MCELKIEDFKQLSFSERSKVLRTLEAEEVKLKEKVHDDEGGYIVGKCFKQSPLRKEWEEKIKLLISLYEVHRSL